MTIWEAKEWAREIHPRLVVFNHWSGRYYEVRYPSSTGKQVAVAYSLPELHGILQGIQVGKKIFLTPRRKTATLPA